MCPFSNTCSHLWLEHGPPRVLNIGSPYILFNNPKNAPYQMLASYHQPWPLSSTLSLSQTVKRSVMHYTLPSPGCKAVHLTKDQGHSYPPTRSHSGPKSLTSAQWLLHFTIAKGQQRSELVTLAFVKASILARTSKKNSQAFVTVKSISKTN